MTKPWKPEQVGNHPEIGPVIDLRNPGKSRQEILLEMYQRGEFPLKNPPGENNEKSD